MVAMDKIMASGHVRLKGGELQKRLVNNMHQAALRGEVSYPTLHRYLNSPDEVNSISTKTLYAILVHGMGLTEDEVANMRFGDVFDVVAEVSE
ncbi:MAG: hypothetical protein M9928_22415 [Anaerolineae bacterium]|nr:hypothetical protein [Anaerolineae bacterium]